MPELSRFFGIIIRMFVETGGQHHRAHFHAFYQEHAAVFAVDTLECLDGSLPKPQQRLVEAWAEIHLTRGVAARLGALAIRPAARQDRSTSGRSMSHPIHRVTQFSIVGPYTLVVAFADGTEQRIDFRPVLRGRLFGPLQDLATFNAVRLDTEVGTLVWPNDADFDPATLHDWPDVGEELATRARAWDVPRNERADTRMEPTRR